MGSELTVAVSLTVVPWLLLRLRRSLELVPPVQFYGPITDRVLQKPACSRMSVTRAP